MLVHQRPARVLASLWTRYKELLHLAQIRFSRKSIHELRIASRRLEAALTLVDGLCRKHQAKDLMAIVRRTRKKMGALRDAQVEARMGKTFLQHHSFRTRNGLIRFYKDTEKNEQKKVKIFFKELSMEDAEKLLRGIVKELRERDKSMAPAQLINHIDSVVGKSQRRVSKSRATLSPRKPKRLHRFRVLVKRLRYQGEVQMRLFGDSSVDIKNLKRAQRVAGVACDEQVFRKSLKCYFKGKKHPPRIVAGPKDLQTTIDTLNSIRC
jgi:CHAD domain-containing protein